MAQIKKNPIQSGPAFSIPEKRLVASAAKNNTPVAIERTFVIFGFKMVEFWVNSFELTRKPVLILALGSINRLNRSF